MVFVASSRVCSVRRGDDRVALAVRRAIELLRWPVPALQILGPLAAAGRRDRVSLRRPYTADDPPQVSVWPVYGAGYCID